MTDNEKLWDVIRATEKQVAVQVQALDATNARLAQGEKNTDTILAKISEVSLSIKGLEINTSNLSKATEASNLEAKAAFKAMEVTISNQRKSIQDQTEKDLTNWIKVVVSEHARTCQGPVRKALTQKQIVAWGGVSATVLGGVGYIISLLVK